MGAVPRIRPLARANKREAQVTIEMTAVGPPLTDARIDALERGLCVTLPADYRSFLIRYNGGVAKPPFFPIRDFDGNPFDAIQVFFGIDVEIRSTDLVWNYSVMNGRIPQDLFPIACTGAGDLVLLSIRGQDKGAVFFWDHESEHSPPTYDNIFLIAATFHEFLESMYFQDLSGLLSEGKVIKGH